MDLSTIDQELDKLKTKLADLSSRYEDTFPEIRALKRQIAALEKMRDQRVVDVKTKGASTQPDGSPTVSAEESVDAKTQPQLFQLRSNLQSNQAEIRSREQSIAALTSRIDDYQARLNQEPVREQQLADLTRGYDHHPGACRAFAHNSRRTPELGSGQGTSLNSTSLTPKPLASSVYVYVPKAPSPPQTVDISDVPCSLPRPTIQVLIRPPALWDPPEDCLVGRRSGSFPTPPNDGQERTNRPRSQVARCRP